MQKYLLLLFISVGLGISGCKQLTLDEQWDLDRQLIDDYVVENGLEDGMYTDAGTYYLITEPGTSNQKPTVDSEVAVTYRGTLLNGKEFDASGSRIISFGLWQVIEGWRDGMQQFTKGSTGILIIPSALGYGNQKVGKIKKNSVLVFEIELIDIFN
ncbi:MAG: FKBP-type peptidyl-prolyl cis-trans isomerase [Bacteroidota bacterium]